MKNREIPNNAGAGYWFKIPFPNTDHSAPTYCSVDKYSLFYF